MEKELLLSPHELDRYNRSADFLQNHTVVFVSQHEIPDPLLVSWLECDPVGVLMKFADQTAEPVAYSKEITADYHLAGPDDAVLDPSPALYGLLAEPPDRNPAVPDSSFYELSDDLSDDKKVRAPLHG